MTTEPRTRRRLARRKKSGKGGYGKCFKSKKPPDARKNRREV